MQNLQYNFRANTVYLGGYKAGTYCNLCKAGSDLD
jgi:hypothetical protein